MIVETLRKKLQSIEPAVQLVEPRILRRVIRLDRRLPGFGLSVLRRKSYTIERDRLLAFVDRAELDLATAADLPRVVILLAKPDDEQDDSPAGSQSIFRRYARLLFHACVKTSFQERLADKPEAEVWATERRHAIGDVEFAEIRSVLLKDEFLFPGSSDIETYCEFAAVYLELRYFAPQQLPQHFPAIRNWDVIARIVGQDVDHADHFQRLCAGLLPPAAQATDVLPSDESEQHLDAVGGPRITVTLAEFRKRQAQAERIAALGNGVKATILHARAALVAPNAYVAEAELAARGELVRVALRLTAVLQLSEAEAEEWSLALLPLIGPAAEGYWSNEARLLYDLQKVCVEQERGVYRLDLIEWLRTRGARPLRRPLPLLRDALMLRHLRTASRRVQSARISARERARLTALLSQVLTRKEESSRTRLRPTFFEVFDEVGLRPANVPEAVARRKLVEELLDRVVESSYLNMANLRDALSKNELKLPDVLSVADLAHGDRLLRADKKLDARLDGVYRRGAVYQRWPQTISSLAFGTRFGRFLTQHIALPFGGAYLAVEFILHITHLVNGHGTEPHEAAAHAVAHSAAGPVASWLFYGSVLLLGGWASLLLHRPAFRAWNLKLLESLWWLLKQTFVEIPARVLRSTIVQQILNSHAYATLHSYVLRPAVLTGFIYLMLYLIGERWSSRGVAELYLVSALLLNSSVGRYVTELSADLLVRAWHELRIRVLGAVIQWIMDVFHGLLVGLERLVYMVDEWLRFRAGDGRAQQGVKLVGGVVWFFVAYVVVFVFTLLVEPQINPIKHFPVVTVSHKLIFPMGPVFVGYLSKYIGTAWAYTLVWTTIWLIPGVFGFLVWELKENWRLYAANRQRSLRPVAIGSHGETMARLLRPGFHSGTLPKAFNALRRAARKVESTGNPNLLNRRLAAIHHVESDIRNFVERELVVLLEESGSAPTAGMLVSEVRTATNRVDAELRRLEDPDRSLLLTWEEDAGVLVASLEDDGFVATLSLEGRTRLFVALAGLLQRSGVEHVRGPLSVSLAPIDWDAWVATWSTTSLLTRDNTPAPAVESSPLAALSSRPQ